ncbi:MAG TPA: hypothetical protein VFV67_20855 [Actinophytocola sp.]|uniref:hypothetical protein n=1 Tax=Actinophytocola sp. TaxID=1872138 RepID=UPI002DBF4056|nr:hypothetical protein [Actinophytocola sp.]HEU5473104.1 hypothetical protein [Actinophytocola sp.]
MAEPDIGLALRDLGAHLDVPEPPDVTAAVRARLEQPVRRTWSTPRRIAAAVLLVLLALGVLITVSPPVRAAVLNLLRFAGIEFSTDSAPAPSPLPSTAALPGERAADLDTARRESRFTVSVPEALGPPERVVLADGSPPRIVSLIYRDGAVRLDQFDGTVDFALYKKLIGGGQVDWTDVDGDAAVWVAGPHELVYVDRSGQYRQESARLSGTTLIWQRDGVTMRLEGDFTKAEALAIAESVR